MRPPMNQKVVALLPLLDDTGQPITDDYGRPKTNGFESKARVQFKAQVVRDMNGTEHRVNLEIDIPPEFNPDAGTEITYTDIAGRTFKGVIRAKEEAVNIPATVVYFRTVYVDG